MGHLRLRRIGETDLFTAPAQVSLLSSSSPASESQLLIDTGASTLFLSESLIESLGGVPTEPQYEVGGLTGRAKLSSVSDVKVMFGLQDDRRAIRLLKVPVLPRTSILPVPADGVLGALPLHLLRATVTIDYDTGLGTLEWP